MRESSSNGDDIYITETQKSIARVHRIPDELLRSLWNETKAEQGTAAGLGKPRR